MDNNSTALRPAMESQATLYMHHLPTGTPATGDDRAEGGDQATSLHQALLDFVSRPGPAMPDIDTDFAQRDDLALIDTVTTRLAQIRDSKPPVGATRPLEGDQGLLEQLLAAHLRLRAAQTAEVTR